MITHEILYQIQYFICFIIYILEKLTFKYILNKDIIVNFLNIIKYDKLHSLFILYIIFNIQIYTIQKDDTKIIHIYYQNKKVSSLILKNEIPINSKNKIVLTFYYLDKYNIINSLEIYNCGVINHTTKLFKHIYNYLGNRRIEYDNITIYK